jgi:hypothetical protein
VGDGLAFAAVFLAITSVEQTALDGHERIVVFTVAGTRISPSVSFRTRRLIPVVAVTS